MANIERTYTEMHTTARLNYCTACNFSDDSLAGSLARGVRIKAPDNWLKCAFGHTWYKIKVGHRHYYACTRWLEKV